MYTFIIICIWILIVGALAYHKVKLTNSLATLVGIAVLSFIIQATTAWTLLVSLLIIGGIAFLLLNPIIRRKYLVGALLKTIQTKTLKISSTEQEALDAGTVWWDGELFSGNPKWHKLLSLAAPHLTKEEQDFLQGPVEELCRNIDNWQINYQLRDLPPAMWEFIKKEKFFGLMIPVKYGGLGFSAFAHSEILAKIAGKSITVASTVSVPNSLGPAELILHYGTDKQKQHYLPNLASGKEIPCFALTSSVAGSDATAINDTGIIKKIDGKLGIELNWDKRYITLAPIATVMGLAFKLYDPEKLLGDKDEYGITCALIPTNTQGITIGDRHWPLDAMFQNGPTQGKDVFIPIDSIIGGREMAGKGWKMLVESLSCGRVISLPSVTAGKAQISAQTTGAYAAIRRQFNQPIGKFEGIEEPLARIAANLYICDAARQITAASIDAGEQPTVPGAIVKYHVTERTRKISIDAMDVHGGKGIMQGPKNYLAEGYINAPIAITVEGANILTRSMIIFGQGAIRAHPFAMQELKALQESNPLVPFDKILSEHVSYTLSNAARALFGYTTRGKFSGAPDRHTQMVSWASSSFAFIADVCLMTIGGKLKFKEKLSGRLGDLLSLLYLSSMVIKRFHDDQKPAADKALVDWAIQDLLHEFWVVMGEIIDNFPQKYIALCLRTLIMPMGIPIKKPSDKLGHDVAQILLKPNETRERLLNGAYLSANELNPAGQLEIALKHIVAAEDAEKRMSRAIKDNVVTGSTLEDQITHAIELTLIYEHEAALLRQAHKVRAEIVAVDHFTKAEITECKQQNMPG